MEFISLMDRMNEVEECCDTIDVHFEVLDNYLKAFSEVQYNASMIEQYGYSEMLQAIMDPDNLLNTSDTVMALEAIDSKTTQSAHALKQRIKNNESFMSSFFDSLGNLFKKYHEICSDQYSKLYHVNKIDEQEFFNRSVECCDFSIFNTHSNACVNVLGNLNKNTRIDIETVPAMFGNSQVPNLKIDTNILDNYQNVLGFNLRKNEYRVFQKQQSGELILNFYTFNKQKHLLLNNKVFKRSLREGKWNLSNIKGSFKTIEKLLSCYQDRAFEQLMITTKRGMQLTEGLWVFLSITMAGIVGLVGYLYRVFFMDIGHIIRNTITAFHEVILYVKQCYRDCKLLFNTWISVSQVAVSCAI